jgi:carboxyl-terminal processing protease
MQGVFNGIGAVIAIVKETRNEIEQRRVCVVAPVPGGPCSRAGIRAGDYITGVDGRWVIAYDPRLDLNRLALRTMPDKEYRQTIKDASKKLQDGMSWPRALDQLTQAAGKPLKLTIDRPGSAAPFDVEVTREETRVVPAEFQQVRPGVGYLRVTQFTPVAAAAVTEALKSRGAIRRIIVDLRDNAGGPDVAGAQGVVGSASAIVGALGIAGEIGFSAKGAKRTPIVAPEAGDPRKDAPTLKGNLAVLVNRGTANIAEVVAAALRARGGATLVGAATHGDSAYQKLVRLSHGGMTLSAGSYLTTDGKPVPAGGLKPAVKVETGGPATGKDAAFTKALASLTRTDGGNQ